MGEGCPEKIDWEFFKWVWNYPKRSREITLEIIRNSGKRVIILKNPREVKQLINAVRRGDRKTTTEV
jgi:hypothetical protein